jgi:hypothetical protein
MTLESYLKDKNAKRVAKHEPFKDLPKELKPPAGLQFVADTDDMKAFLKFVMQLNDVSVGWVLKTKGGQVLPMGVVVHTKKQVIMPAGGRIQLT